MRSNEKREDKESAIVKSPGRPVKNREMTLAELAALGRIVQASAVFESKLDWAMAAMMKLSEDVFPHLMAGKTLGPKVNLFSIILTSKIAEIRNQQRKEWSTTKIKVIVKAMNDAVTKRNVVVHGLWSPGGHGDSLWALLNPELSEAPIAAASKKGATKVFAKELGGLAGTFEQLTESVSAAYWEFFMQRLRKSSKK